MEDGVCQLAGFTFSSNFDSGNLAHVELAGGGSDTDTDSEAGRVPHTARPTTSTATTRAVGTDCPDYEFQLWTRPDCQGTEFENGNRTWFYFGLRGGQPGAILKFTVQNMNKQYKLFSQGMAPVFMVPGRSGWERVRDLPTYSTQENNFTMSFKFRHLEEPNSQVYFAFSYPFTYKELQANLGRLEKKHSTAGLGWAELQELPATATYFHRELAIRSLEQRRLDLLTITSLAGLQPQREPCPANLFPDSSLAQPRPHKFAGKPVVFLSARVHPGETCSSYVIAGFIKFLLTPGDARAAALRAKYVFKLVPMLNPDGVYRGHYRTDTRGVNLNRVYSEPSLQLHPTIYAAKQLILLAHMGQPVEEAGPAVSLAGPPPDQEDGEEERSDVTGEDTGPGPGLTELGLVEPEWYKPLSLWDGAGGRGRTSTSSRTSSTAGPTALQPSPAKGEMGLNWYEMTDTSRCSEGDESVADFSVPSYGLGALLGTAPTKQWLDDSSFLPPEFPSSSSSKRSPCTRTSFAGAFKSEDQTGPEEVLKKHNLLDPIFDPEAEPAHRQASELDADIPFFKPPSGESGLFLYVDIHGHASKRGIFMYGNHFEDLETKISTLLYPKLMSINSANFDFPACNFTAKNMYMKDRHTGAGKEGSGRVSVYKATGLTYCYTLECNFNTGRHTNPVPLSSRDCGRASPPPQYDHPPKYGPEVYEQCGRYLAISALDLTEGSNPWTRLPCSSCKTVKGVRSWIKTWLKSAEAEAAAKPAAKQSKSSPVRTRLRSLSSTKKSQFPQNILTKSPSSLELAGSTSSSQTRSLAKLPRKAISPKHSQSLPGKATRQPARTLLKSVEGSKKRLGSGKKARPKSASKIKSRNNSNPTSRSGSRSTSPTLTRRDRKLEPKVTKVGLQKKALQKAARKTLEDQSISEAVSIKKVKRKKKRVVTSSS